MADTCSLMRSSNVVMNGRVSTSVQPLVNSSRYWFKMRTKNVDGYGMHSSARMRDRFRHSCTCLGFWCSTRPASVRQNNTAHWQIMRHWSCFSVSRADSCVTLVAKFS